MSVVLPPSVVPLFCFHSIPTMQSAVASLESRVSSGLSDLYAHHDQVNADKRLLLHRTLDTMTALDATSRHSRHSSAHSRTMAANNILPLLKLLPLPDSVLSLHKDDATVCGMDEWSTEAEEATAAAADVLTVAATYESGLADSGRCDGRWLIRALVRSRPSYTLHALTLTATTADSRVEMASHATLIPSLPPDCTGCLTCGVEVLSSTSAEVVSIRALLRASHTHESAVVDVWSRYVHLPRYPYPNQHITLFSSDGQCADLPSALSLASLSSAAQPLSLRLDSRPPLSLSAVSRVIQQHLHLEALEPTGGLSAICGVTEARLTASEVLLVSSSRPAPFASVSPFPGVCCVLSAPPSVASPPDADCCWLRLYSESELVALSFIGCLRAALPPSCGVTVDVANPLSIDSVQQALAALTAETEEAVSSQQSSASAPRSMTGRVFRLSSRPVWGCCRCCLRVSALLLVSAGL